MRKQEGFVDEILVLIVGLFCLAIFTLVLVAPWIRWEWSEDNVAGVVYNNTNNAWLSGNTKFSIRASEESLVTEENRSSYCLPPGSPYIGLVTEAAKDKSIKVIVTTEKVFTFVPTPWTCLDNVTVERVN